MMFYSYFIEYVFPYSHDHAYLCSYCQSSNPVQLLVLVVVFMRINLATMKVSFVIIIIVILTSRQTAMTGITMLWLMMLTMMMVMIMVLHGLYYDDAYYEHSYHQYECAYADGGDYDDDDDDDGGGGASDDDDA